MRLNFFRGYNCLQVLVRDNNVDQALKALKKKLQREGVFREMKLRGHFEKPSEKRAREKAEAIRRARKLARKKLQREGLLPSKPVVARGAGGKGGPGGGRGPGGGGFGSGSGGSSGGGFSGGSGGGFGSGGGGGGFGGGGGGGGFRSGGGF
jgi:small subunit ribosomal protein S21